MFYPIQDDSFYYLCPDRLRLPLIFYYGHTAVVYMNKLVLGGLVEVIYYFILIFITVLLRWLMYVSKP